MDLMRRQRFCKQETLQHTTSHLGQEYFLLLGLYSFSHHLHIHGVGYVNNSRHNLCIFAVLVDIFNKYSVNF